MAGGVAHRKPPVSPVKGLLADPVRLRGLLAKIGDETVIGGAIKGLLGAAALPGDVYAGRVDPRSDEAIERSFDLASSLALGAGTVPARGLELRSGTRLPSSSSLVDVPHPTREQMAKRARVEAVPLSQARGTQRKMNWKDFDAGDHPPVLIQGYEKLPVAVRREDGEYLILDGHHRTARALSEGRTSLDMYVIDAKDYAPDVAGRKPSKATMSADELDELFAELRGITADGQ